MKTVVLGTGYEEVIADGVTSGLVVLQVKSTLQLLAPDAMTQEGAEEVRVPDIGAGVTVTVVVDTVSGVPDFEQVMV